MILDGGIEKVVVNGKTTYDFKHLPQREEARRSACTTRSTALSRTSRMRPRAGPRRRWPSCWSASRATARPSSSSTCAGKYRQFLSSEENRKLHLPVHRPGPARHLRQDHHHRVPDLRGPDDPGHEPLRGPGREPRRSWRARSASPTEEIETLLRQLPAAGGLQRLHLERHPRRTAAATWRRCSKFVEIIPVPLTESLGTVTGKYPAKDKITSSAVDLLGEESIQRLLHITDTNNPYRFDLRRGALARVAGGGIHFADEIFKNKKDLVQVYLGVIQNRTIEIDGYKWPIDTLIVATSNNSEFNRFLSEKEEAPIIDRCRICYVSHNTNYRLQEQLTAYAIGSETQDHPDHGGAAPGPEPELCRLGGGGPDPPAPLGEADPGRDHEAGRRRGGRREEHQDPGRGDRHPQPGPGHHQALRPEGAGPAQPGPGHPAAGGELGDQRGRLHVRLRRLQGPGAGRARLRDRRQRPRQVPGGPEDRQGALPRTDHDRDVQRLHG